MIHYFLKLKFYLGFTSAIHVYFNKVILKSKLSVPFLKHKITIRHNDFADNQTFNEVILKGCYRNLLSNKSSVTRIVDLGSNIGLSAASFLSEYPNASIVVVEPEKDNVLVLNENLQPYIDEGRTVFKFNSPVYSKEVVLNLFDSLKGSHGFRVSENLESSNSLQTMDSVTINGILEKVGWDSIDIIKIDIEGAEFELLQENIEWIQKTKYLIIETHDRFKKGSTKQLFKSLEPFNYMVQIINENFFIKFY